MSLDATTRAAIIGGFANVMAIFAGLLGVYVNLAWNRKQHQDEKSYNLRRDVYLESIDAISRAAKLLPGIAIPTSDEKREAAKKKEEEISTNLSGACAKLHILGTQRVVAAAIAFESLFEEWSSKVYATRRAYNEGKNRSDDVIKQIEQLRDAILAALAPKGDVTGKPAEPARNTGDDPGESAKRTEDAARVAKEVQARVQQKVDSLTEQLLGESTDIFQNLGAATDYLLDVPKALNPVLTELTLAMKSDLGLPSNDAWYKAAMTKASDDSLRSCAQQLESIREEIRKHSTKTSAAEKNLGELVP